MTYLPKRSPGCLAPMRDPHPSLHLPPTSILLHFGMLGDAMYALVGTGIPDA
jgi:hypothetical protein